MWLTVLPMEAVVSHDFTMPPRLAASPDIGAGHYIDIGDDTEYFYDTSRSKWLSVELMSLDFGRNGTHASARYLATNYVTHTATRGFTFARLATIVGVQMRIESDDTPSLWLYRNEGVISSHNLGAPNANQDLYSNSLDIDVVNVTDAGLYPYTLYVDGAGDDEIGALLYRWRQS